MRGEDALFLYSETGHSSSNITFVHLYDPSTAVGGAVHFKGLLKHVESRLHLSPVFRQRLLRVPFDLDLPYWVEDDRFDLEYHVRHTALPKPGDWRQFCIQASRIHARPLDLSRPLWELYLVEGIDSFLELPPHSFAVLTKIHHAALDPVHGADLITLLHDDSPSMPPPAPPEPWFPEDPPGLVQVLARGVSHNLISPFSLATPLARVARRFAPVVIGSLSEALLRRRKFPVARFNAEVSPHRVFETRRFTLDEFRRIRALVPGATVNDCVFAVCGGALRRYLQAQDELPRQSLVSVAPVSVRSGASGAASEVTLLRVPLGTDIADPIARLRAVRRHTRGDAGMADAVAAKELTDITKHAPAATLARTARLLGAALLGAGRRTPLANCTITNLPGPGVPLYLDGARMTYFSAMMPIADGMGLVFAVTSYDGRIMISPTACREMVPDPEVLAQCIRDSFQEYLALAAPKPVKNPRRVRRSRAVSPARGKAARSAR
ncbi:MAG: wax ester/triacylglycerol synthase family O-acyltransferase [Steroidobacteraceae bacterium]|nr:wax ester/triacylglycerol synthase family O-acyltransferase [Steroidobacteraceae bacterium]